MSSRRRRNRFASKNRAPTDMSLQITSMADIFTILLVFLLKSFSTGATNLAPSADMVLPEVKESVPLIETLKLEVAKNTIIVDEKPVTRLRGFDFEPADLERDGTPRSLNAALAKERQKNTLQKYPRLMILADQDVPYSTVRRVLASASNSGFEDFKLVVVEDK